jgi:AcrR family transcriptional regulator
MAEKKSSTNGKAKAARRARGSLSQEEILDVAKALVETEGLAALNMPALARALNSGVTSIYWYFRSKDELVTALTDKVAREMYRGLPPVGEGAWDDELCDYFAAFRQLLNETPIYREVFAYRSQSLYQDGALAPGLLRRLEAGMEVLMRTGMAPADAAALMRACSNYTRGFVLLEHGIAAERSVEAPDVTEVSAAAMVAADAERYPALAAIPMLDAMFELDDSDFINGLRLLVEGAKRRLESSKA